MASVDFLSTAGASCEQAGASADEASDGCGSNGGAQPFIFTRRGNGWGQPWGSCAWCGWATNATSNTKGQQHANRRFGGRGQPATLMERYRRSVTITQYIRRSISEHGYV